MRIGIVAGELSGDILAAGLINEIKKKYPDAEFIGIAGPLMQQAGCVSIVPMEKLSVMGIVEVLSCYLELRKIQQSIIDFFLQEPPDLFIGVDAPDFNLSIEKKLKEKGIKTIQYVSPSVWAWRQYRINKITQSVGLMLTLFPFEKKFYDNYQMPVEFVGHTLADSIDMQTDKQQARKNLSIADPIKEHEQVIALLPGSRQSEVKRLIKPFLDTALACNKINPNILFIIPLADESLRSCIEAQLNEYIEKPRVLLVNGQSQEVMAAADAVLLASGTATLEALLLKKPMIVCYKMSPITYWITRKLAKVPFFSLPNLLSGEELVEEMVQEEVNAENLTPKVFELLVLENWQDKLDVFHDIHSMLRKDANRVAANAVIDYLQAETSNSSLASK